jgi:hypothetical protein
LQAENQCAGQHEIRAGVAPRRCEKLGNEDQLRRASMRLAGKHEYAFPGATN